MEPAWGLSAATSAKALDVLTTPACCRATPMVRPESPACTTTVARPVPVPVQSLLSVSPATMGFRTCTATTPAPPTSATQSSSTSRPRVRRRRRRRRRSWGVIGRRTARAPGRDPAPRPVPPVPGQPPGQRLVPRSPGHPTRRPAEAETPAVHGVAEDGALEALVLHRSWPLVLCRGLRGRRGPPSPPACTILAGRRPGAALAIQRCLEDEHGGRLVHHGPLPAAGDTTVSQCPLKHPPSTAARPPGAPGPGRPVRRPPPRKSRASAGRPALKPGEGPGQAHDHLEHRALRTGRRRAMARRPDLPPRSRGSVCTGVAITPEGSLAARPTADTAHVDPEPHAGAHPVSDLR